MIFSQTVLLKVGYRRLLLYSVVLLLALGVDGNAEPNWVGWINTSGGSFSDRQNWYNYDYEDDPETFQDERNVLPSQGDYIYFGAAVVPQSYPVQISGVFSAGSTWVDDVVSLNATAFGLGDVSGSGKLILSSGDFGARSIGVASLELKSGTSITFASEEESAHAWWGTFGVKSVVLDGAQFHTGSQVTMDGYLESVSFVSTNSDVSMGNLVSRNAFIEFLAGTSATILGDSDFETEMDLQGTRLLIAQGSSVKTGDVILQWGEGGGSQIVVGDDSLFDTSGAVELYAYEDVSLQVAESGRISVAGGISINGGQITTADGVLSGNLQGLARNFDTSEIALYNTDLILAGGTTSFIGRLKIGDELGYARISGIGTIESDVGFALHGLIDLRDSPSFIRMGAPEFLFETRGFIGGTMGSSFEVYYTGDADSYTFTLGLAEWHIGDSTVTFSNPENGPKSKTAAVHFLQGVTMEGGTISADQIIIGSDDPTIDSYLYGGGVFQGRLKINEGATVILSENSLIRAQNLTDALTSNGELWIYESVDLQVDSSDAKAKLHGTTRLSGSLIFHEATDALIDLGEDGVFEIWGGMANAGITGNGRIEVLGNSEVRTELGVKARELDIWESGTFFQNGFDNSRTSVKTLTMTRSQFQGSGIGGLNIQDGGSFDVSGVIAANLNGTSVTGTLNDDLLVNSMVLQTSTLDLGASDLTFRYDASLIDTTVLMKDGSIIGDGLTSSLSLVRSVIQGSGTVKADGGIKSEDSIFNAGTGSLLVEGDLIGTAVFIGNVMVSGNTTGTVAAHFQEYFSLSGGSAQIITNGDATFDGGLDLGFEGILRGAENIFNTVNSILSGAGILEANLTNSGKITPGNSPGILQIQGDVFLASTSELIFELGGLNSGTEFDFLDVTGVLTLCGTLEVSLIEGFASIVGNNDVFVLVRADEINGSFDHPTQRIFTTDGLGSFELLVSNDEVALSNYQAIPEPSTWALLGIGAVVLGLRMTGRRKVA